MLVIIIVTVYVTSDHHFSDQRSFLHHCHPGSWKALQGRVVVNVGKGWVSQGSEAGLVILMVSLPYFPFISCKDSWRGSSPYKFPLKDQGVHITFFIESPWKDINLQEMLYLDIL